MSSPPDASPYLRAATAGLRHHARALTTGTPTARQAPGRSHLDALHAHLTALHQLLDQCAEQTRPPHPTAGRHLAAAHTRIWQATAEVHDAFHTLPSSTDCDPTALPEGPPVLTICQRHLAAGHTMRRKTTPTDLTRAS
ncbi:DUF6238 family protein [Streptomyces sp. NPDC059076]|uniref:DUF6238 family protein n=1 Tax=unclassified Streptomyces TaxID=2593676 RepID=UPI0036A7929C